MCSSNSLLPYQESLAPSYSAEVEKNPYVKLPCSFQLAFIQGMHCFLRKALISAWSIFCPNPLAPAPRNSFNSCDGLSVPPHCHAISQVLWCGAIRLPSGSPSSSPNGILSCSLSNGCLIGTLWPRMGKFCYT